MSKLKVKAHEVKEHRRNFDYIVLYKMCINNIQRKNPRNVGLTVSWISISFQIFILERFMYG